MCARFTLYRNGVYPIIHPLLIMNWNFGMVATQWGYVSCWWIENLTPIQTLVSHDIYKVITYGQLIPDCGSNAIYCFLQRDSHYAELSWASWLTLDNILCFSCGTMEKIIAHPCTSEQKFAVDKFQVARFLTVPVAFTMPILWFPVLLVCCYVFISISRICSVFSYVFSSEWSMVCSWVSYPFILSNHETY